MLMFPASPTPSFKQKNIEVALKGKEQQPFDPSGSFFHMQQLQKV